MAEAFQLEVQTDQEMTLMITANSEMKAEELIKAVAQESNYDAASVLLYYGDTKISGNRVLRSFGISSTCTLHMFYRESFTIAVITQDGISRTMKITSDDTTDSLTAKVLQRIDGTFELKYNDIVLSKGQNLVALGIQEYSTIHVIRITQGGMIWRNR